MATSVGDDVDQLARYHDDLADLLAFNEFLHRGQGFGLGFKILLGDIRRDLQAATQFAIDLHHDLQGTALHGLGFGFWPLGIDHSVLVAESGPEGVAQVRRDRRQHQYGGFQGLLNHGAVLVGLCAEFADFVEQFHDGGNGGIEGEAPADVVTDLGDGFMGLAAQGLLVVVQAGTVQGRCRHRRRRGH